MVLVGYLFYAVFTEDKLSNFEETQNMRLLINGLESNTAPWELFVPFGYETLWKVNVLSRNSPCIIQILYNLHNLNLFFIHITYSDIDLTQFFCTKYILLL